MALHRRWYITYIFPSFPLQVLFAHLCFGRTGSFYPRAFWLSFKDYDGRPVDIKEHQDAYEFFTRLQVRSVPHPFHTHSSPSHTFTLSHLTPVRPVSPHCTPPHTLSTPVPAGLCGPTPDIFGPDTRNAARAGGALRTADHLQGRGLQVCVCCWGRRAPQCRVACCEVWECLPIVIAFCLGYLCCAEGPAAHRGGSLCLGYVQHARSPPRQE